MTKEEIQLAIRVLGTKDVQDLGTKTDELRRKLEAMHAVPPEQRDKGWANEIRKLNDQLKANAPLLEEHATNMAKAGGAGGASGKQDQAAFSLERALSQLLSGKLSARTFTQLGKGAEGLGVVGSGVGLATAGFAAQQVFQRGSQAVHSIAPDVYNYQISQLSSVLVDLRRTIGESYRSMLFGAEGNRQITIEPALEKMARGVEDLKAKGFAGRSADEDQELRGKARRLSELEHGLASWESMKDQPSALETGRASAIKEYLDKMGAGNIARILQDYVKRQLEDTDRTMRNQKEARWQAIASGDKDAEAKIQEQMAKTRNDLAEIARADTGRLMNRALEGIPDAMDKFVETMRGAGLNMNMLSRDMEQNATRAARAMETQRNAMAHEERMEEARQGMEQRAKRAGIKLTPQERDRGAEAAVEAFEGSGGRIPKPMAGAIGAQAIGQNADKFNAEAKARNAMAQMLPDMRDLAAGNAGVPITAEMVRSALQEATGAIAKGAFAMPSIYGAMNRQVMEMQQYAYQMQMYANQFNMLMPAGSMWGGMW